MYLRPAVFRTRFAHRARTHADERRGIRRSRDAGRPRGEQEERQDPDPHSETKEADVNIRHMTYRVTTWILEKLGILEYLRTYATSQIDTRLPETLQEVIDASDLS